MSVRAKLEVFTGTDANIETKQVAANAYWDSFIDERDRLAEQGLLVQSEDAFNAWLWFDYRLSDGRRMVDSFLEDEPSLTAGERVYLERMRYSAVRLYEVEAVVPGSSVALRDMLSARSIQVRERLGSQSMKRWDTIAARLTPMGASGEPEIEDVIPLPRFQVTSIIDALREELSSWRNAQQDAEDLVFFERNVPRWHQLWLQALQAPQVPAVRMNDEEQALITRTHFQVIDAEQAIKVLDAAPDMERDSEQSLWHWRPRRAKKAQSPTRICLQGGSLIVEALTKGSAERARKRVERLLGRSVRAGLTTHQDLQAAMVEPEERGARLESQPGEDCTELDDAVLERYEQHYRGWIDEPVPVLDGHTPREAAKSDNLRPALIRLLKDLEHFYCRSLELGQPAYDASWMWDELDLADTTGAPQQPKHPPPLGHESMARLVPGLADIIRAVVARMRRTYGASEIERVLLGEELAADLGVRRFLEDSARQIHAQGASAENAVSSANLLGMHIEYACNFELHRRKIFWVEEGLVWMLSRTNLDIVGDALRPPFACFALVFADRDTLALAERLLSKEDPCTHRGRLLQVLTVYVVEFQDVGARGLRLIMTFDDLSEDWPYLLCRDLRIDADAHLDTLLESRFPDVDPQQRDPVFDSLLFKRILKRVLNAILYATSAGVAGRDVPKGPPAEVRHRVTQGGVDAAYSSEEVYHLPGHIDIRELRQLQNLSRSPGGGQLMHRFLVRGHWRRPNPSWQDQRPRWIKPYWKGPDVAALIERSYRLRSPDGKGDRVAGSTESDAPTGRKPL